MPIKESAETSNTTLFTLKEFCEQLSISVATGKNWLRLGKITPTQMIDHLPFFSADYIDNLKKEILSGGNNALKSRRNKKYVSGNRIYQSYLPATSLNYELSHQLITYAETINLSEETINYILAEVAIRLLCQTGLTAPSSVPASYLLDYLNQNISLGIYRSLVEDLIESCTNARTLIENSPFVFDLPFIYEEKEDLLGLLYLSLQNLRDRKATGSYYTPAHIVEKLILHSTSSGKTLDQRTILDPCCGTGNFLLHLPKHIPMHNIYGMDIDSNSVKLTRINLALRHSITSTDILYEHITTSDFLSSGSKFKYDLIIGNPPWGYAFSKQEKAALKARFSCCSGNHTESYDIFIEQSLRMLSPHGVLSFVLPEAVLNVTSHTPIRKYILENANITTLEYLGNAFAQVQCPCIILELKKDDSSHSTIGTTIVSSARSFVIETERPLNAKSFCLDITEPEFQLLQKVTEPSQKAFLAGHADFALGIVTGNNKDYIAGVQTEKNERILKGSDIFKYRFVPSDHYICFTPEQFQQVAPTEYYRAPEKLLYRFICNQLVFAYDDQKTLSLNSCNLVIPHLEHLHIKYILAILNSRIAQFVFKKQFRSVKVLRSHIEQIPIPMISKEEQEQITTFVNKLLLCNDETLTNALYNEIDQMVAHSFHLTDTEYDLILKETGNSFLFLPEQPCRNQ